MDHQYHVSQTKKKKKKKNFFVSLKWDTANTLKWI